MESGLIKCPECGKEISAAAKACPNCGYPMKEKKWNLPMKKVGIVTAIVVVAIICIVAAIFGNKLSEEEQANVDNVSAMIDDIGEVVFTSESDIEKAEEFYGKLSKKCQRHVKNHKKLSEARDTYNTLRAEEVVKLIDQMGEAALDNQKIIYETKESYDALTDEQRELVENAEDLLSAMEQLSALKIEDINSQISAIGKVTLDSNLKIKEARRSYDALTDEEKSKVSKYNVLKQAESDYEKLAIDACISAIDGIGEVTLDSKDKIDESKKLYDSLSKKVRDKVTNYEVLKNASDQYEKLLKEEEIRQRTLNAGDSFISSKWEITYTKTNINAKILPNNASGYYLYYYAKDNETFVDIVFQIKNIDTDILGIQDIVGACKVEYDNSELTKRYELYISNGSQINPVYSWDGLDALDSTTLHVAIRMPREVQTNDKSLTVKLVVAGEEKIINVR